MTMHAPQAESPRNKLSSMAGVVAGPASKADAPAGLTDFIGRRAGPSPRKWALLVAQPRAEPNPTKYALSGSNAFSASGR